MFNIIDWEKKIISYSIILLPLSLVFSIAVAELLVLIINIFFILEIVKKKFRFDKFSLFICLFVIYVTIRSITYENSLEIKSTVFYFRFFLFSYALFYFNKKYSLIQNLSRIFFITFIILIIDGFFQFIFGFNILGKPPVTDYRISSFFGDELVLGSFLVRLIAISFIFLLIKINDNKYLSFFYFSALTITILLSGERTAIFLFLFYGFLTFLFLPLLRKKILYIFLVFCLTITLLLNFSFAYKLRYITDTFTNFNLYDGDKISIKNIEGDYKKINIFSSHYQDHYEAAILMFKDKYYFGQGTKMFRVKCKEEKFTVSDVSCSSHPHNILMQFISELGLVGFFFLLVFHILIFYEIKKISRSNINIKHKSIIFFSLLGILINIFPLIPSGNFFNNWLSIILSINLSYYLYFKDKIND